MPATEQGLYRQLAAALSTGNSVVIDNASGLEKSIYGLPATVTSRIVWADDWAKSGPFAGALVEGDAERIVAVNKKIAALPGPLVLVQAATTEALTSESQPYNLDWLVEEVSVSVNTTAAGGNASLMSIG
ncbi:Bifunctional protein PutA [compost metagenome]